MVEGLPGANIPPHLLKGPPSEGAESLSARVRRSQQSGDKEELKKMSQEFESLLVLRLLQEMRKSVPKSGFLDGGQAMEMYEGMLDEAVAQEVSKGRGIGIGEVLFRQLSENVPAKARESSGGPEKASGGDRSQRGAAVPPVAPPPNREGTYE